MNAETNDDIDIEVQLPLELRSLSVSDAPADHRRQNFIYQACDPIRRALSHKRVRWGVVSVVLLVATISLIFVVMPTGLPNRKDVFGVGIENEFANDDFYNVAGYSANNYPAAGPNDNYRPSNNNNGRPSNNNNNNDKPSKPSNSNKSSSSSSSSSSEEETPIPTVPFIPGDLTVRENGLILSTGLKSEVIALSGQRVIYRNGRKSKIKFHANPDGGAVFADPQGRGWVYVGNSELEDGHGGTGALRFDGKGRVIDYRMILEGTTKNCSGGKTPWNTWISAEENKAQGLIHEADPFGRYKANVTVLGEGGGAFESVAVDDRNPNQPIFFVTHDKKTGELRRFRPHVKNVKRYKQQQRLWRILTKPGKMDYLVLRPNKKTFYWSNNKLDGQTSAGLYFHNLEGIDYRDGILMFVSKKQNDLFILDLDKRTYKVENTESGLFNGSPDQLARFMHEPESDMLFFTEEHGKQGVGVHARDANGHYYTILENDADKVRRQETTGLAFSPDNKFMYFGFYKLGVIFAVSREDGLPFHGGNLQLRHHDMKMTAEESDL